MRKEISTPGEGERGSDQVAAVKEVKGRRVLSEGRADRIYQHSVLGWKERESKVIFKNQTE